jgi:hypothetical protein
MNGRGDFAQANPRMHCEHEQLEQFAGRAGRRSPRRFFGVGLVATIVVTVVVARIAKDALKESGAAKDETK